MSASVRLPRVRIVASTLALVGTVLVGTCTDGADPAGPQGESHLSLTLANGFLPALAPDEVRPIERIRITAVEVPGGGVIGGTTATVDPGADPWTVAFSLPLETSPSVTVTLAVELISLSSGTELVEWSGRTGPITLQVGTQTEVADVSLVKGPLANLSVTGLAIDGPDLTIREGVRVQLTTTVTTSTPEDPPTLFWKSLNPGVATVSGEGSVQGVFPGQARIVSTAGTFADTILVTVLAAPASVVLTPAEVLLDALGEEITFVAAVLDPRGEPISEQGVTWTSGNPDVLQHLGEGEFRSVGRGTALATAVSSLDPGISGSAAVTVRQVVTSVQMEPEEGSIFLGETLPFGAIALDANEFPVEGMTFSWSSSEPAVASVDDSGLAAGLTLGTVTISAASASGELGIGQGETLGPTPGTIGLATLEVLAPVAEVVITPNPGLFTSLGEVQSFSAEAFDEAGTPIPGVTFTWATSDASILTVNDAGQATSVANGSAVLEATTGGIVGVAEVTVDQAVASVTISPDSWSFICPEGCEDRRFSGRAFDALGIRIEGQEFSWRVSNIECSAITDPTGGDPSERVTVDSYCSCWSGSLRARAEGVSGFSSIGADYCEVPDWLTPQPGMAWEGSSPWVILGASRARN